MALFTLGKHRLPPSSREVKGQLSEAAGELFVHLLLLSNMVTSEGEANQALMNFISLRNTVSDGSVWRGECSSNPECRD